MSQQSHEGEASDADGTDDVTHDGTDDVTDDEERERSLDAGSAATTAAAAYLLLEHEPEQGPAWDGG